MKKVALLIAMLVFVSLNYVGCAGIYEGGTFRPMQEDFDKIRLDHVLIINKLINEYKEKVGHYPYEKESADIPIVVIIASEQQIKNDNGRLRIFVDLNTRRANGPIPEPPQRITQIPLADFKTEIERGLGRPISLPIDPQKVPVNKPSVYMYTCFLGVFDVTVFLHNSLAFARPMGEYYNKITVGARTYEPLGIWKPQDLAEEKAFIDFFTAPFNRGGYTIKTDINQMRKSRL